jgi:hypothetical protein
MVVANFDPPGAANGCPPLKEGDAKPGVDTDRSFGPWDSCSRADLEIRVVTAVSGECLAADYGRTARNLSEQSSAPLKASSPGHRLRRISALTPSPMAEFRAPLSNRAAHALVLVQRRLNFSPVARFEITERRVRKATCSHQS